MNSYFDIFLCIPLLWGIYRGFTKGLIIELASLIALGLGIYGAVKFSGYASDFLITHFQIGNQYLKIVSFVITFIFIVMIVFLIAKLVEGLVNIAALSILNKITGALFGLLKMVLMVFAFIFILKSLDQKLNILPSEIKTESFFFKAAEKFPVQNWLEESKKMSEKL